MRKNILTLLFLMLQSFCFAQNRMIDSLKAELKNAKADTTKLSIYIALGEASSKNEKLQYAEPALQLVDKLFLQEKDKEERQKLIGKEQALLNLVGIYYRRSSVAEWDKAMNYLQNRLQAIDKTGDQKRAAAFLYQMAQISVNEKKDSVLFRTYMLRSISIAREIKDSALIVDGYGFMWGVYWSAGNFSEAMNAAQSSLAVCIQLNYAKGLAESRRQIGSLYDEFGEKDLALENFQTSLDIASKTKDSVQLSYTLNSLGDFYLRKKNIKKALEYYDRLLAISNSFKNSPYSPGTVLMMIGYVYLDNNDFENALHYFDESLEKFENRKDFANITFLLSNKGVLYNKKGDYKRASEYNTRAIQIMDSLNDPYQSKSYLVHLLANDYYGMKDYARAKELNDKALVDFKRDWFDISGRVEMELLAMQIDSARGDGFGALAHYKEHMLQKDKLKGDEIKKETLKNRFKSEMEKEKSEQEKKDAIAKRTRNLQYVAIGAMLLLGILALFGYVQKNKDKKKIEQAYTNLKSTQSQLIQSEKMASLGELTAGIAHEIQNPLNFVNNFSEVSNELISEMVDEVNKGNYEEVKEIANDVKQNLEKINHHGQRAADIVKGMLQHSRSSSGVKEPTNINALADEYLRLAYHGLRAKDKDFNATMKTDFDESIGNINIIPQDIGRVILNLITNAFYVVNEKKTLRQAQGDNSYEPTVSVSTKKINGKIEIKVADNGNGIPQKILDKIFQPFFTTKPTGQGTGLGLSLSYDIVKAHGGELKALNKEDSGAEFIINLPS